MANSNSSAASSVITRFGVSSGYGSAPPASASSCSFALLSDDIVLNILAKLEADPRDWARLACVSARLSYLIRIVCFRSHCTRSLPPSLLPSAAAGNVPAAAAAWTALHKLCVCCPGLRHAGVLLENSDFGLERDIGPNLSLPASTTTTSSAATSSSFQSPPGTQTTVPTDCADSCWSLFDDLYFDTVYDHSESQLSSFTPQEPSVAPQNPTFPVIQQASDQTPMEICSASSNKRKKWVEPVGSHLATGPWTLSREQGSKLLASRFRDDCLYICDWPGCVHAEEKRKYMLFRGVFKDFRRSRVWRTISDSNRGKIALDCAFCACKETWDLHSAFCLRRVFGFHDDGEPVVRAYVCENGHVSGAWTERPLYG